jgi:hypothetical protein
MDRRITKAQQVAISSEGYHPDNRGPLGEITIEGLHTKIDKITIDLGKVADHISTTTHIETFRRLVENKPYPREYYEYLPKDESEIDALLALRDEEVIIDTDILKRIKFIRTLRDKLAKISDSLFDKLTKQLSGPPCDS